MLAAASFTYHMACLCRKLNTNKLSITGSRHSLLIWRDKRNRGRVVGVARRQGEFAEPVLTHTHCLA